jgi:hypothetical protein
MRASRVSPARETVRTTEHRQGHAYEHGPNNRCAVKDCGRPKKDH